MSGHKDNDVHVNGHTGCKAPKMARRMKPCGCTSEWVCASCGYRDPRRESDHDERCNR